MKELMLFMSENKCKARTIPTIELVLKAFNTVWYC